MGRVVAQYDSYTSCHGNLTDTSGISGGLLTQLYVLADFYLLYYMSVSFTTMNVFLACYQQYWGHWFSTLQRDHGAGTPSNFEGNFTKHRTYALLVTPHIVPRKLELGCMTPFLHYGYCRTTVLYPWVQCHFVLRPHLQSCLLLVFWVLH